MAVEELLDLAGIDVLAATDDHVLDAADDVAVALVVESGEITGVHPAAGIDGLGGLLGVAPIALHDRIAAGAEFTRRARRDNAAFRVDDLHFHMRVDAAEDADAPPR